jgi:hypothetical protein
MNGGWLAFAPPPFPVRRPVRRRLVAALGEVVSIVA